MNSSLYLGQVYHKRLRPAEHVLRYRVFSLLLDLNEIDDLARKLWPFSRNRWNLLSFYDKDFGDEQQESLQSYVWRNLSSNGINTQPEKIMLSCYPRVFGYTFNPLSLFYCFNANNELYAILHEVHNTFGERHTYVLPVEKSQQQASSWIIQTADKALFVSPFAHMKMHYAFRLNVPGEKQVLVIKASDQKGHLITASYTAKRKVLSTSSLLKVFLTIPLLTFRVIAGIHWEALKLWLKKVPLYSHQPKTAKEKIYTRNNVKNQ